MNIVVEGNRRIEEAKEESCITTGKVRKISAALYKELEEKNIEKS